MSFLTVRQIDVADLTELTRTADLSQHSRPGHFLQPSRHALKNRTTYLYQEIENILFWVARTRIINSINKVCAND